MASRLIAAVAALVVACACELPGSQHDCGNTTVSWVNFIQVGSTQYVWGTVSNVELRENDLGPVYSHVKFRVSDNVCDPSYKVKDGDAAFLDPGTPIYQVKGQPPAEQLGARFNGHLLLYLAIKKGAPPPPGSPPAGY
jgi:hypothetical protein